VRPKLEGPEPARWLAQIDVELDNLYAALDWVITDRAAVFGLKMVGALARC
jgi:hypothetical protein